MRQDKHPSYRPVVFRDRSAGYAFLTRSTATSEETIDWEEGRSYPVIDVEISAESHPFYTGEARAVDSAGQIEKFERRFGGGGGEESDRRLTPKPSEVTPDTDLHTGAEGEVSAEDFVLASGRDVTPANLDWARRKLAERGQEAVERRLP